ADFSSFANSQEYWNSLSGNHRHSIKKAFNKLERSGGFEIVLIGNPGQDVDTAMAQYSDIYSGSWKTRDEEPVFHHKLSKYLLDKGCLRIFLLYHRGKGVNNAKPKPFSPKECLVNSEVPVSGKPIAAGIFIVRGAYSVFLKTAYLQDYASYSPGTLLLWFAFKWLIDVDHVTYIDFLRGDNPYKNKWGKFREKLMICFISNPGSLHANFELWFKVYVFPKLRKFMLRFKRLRYYNRICGFLHFDP
ncbi:MAG: GNAT family N-acetyltransferase, partial [Desulfuromonadaceae bacterium]